MFPETDVKEVQEYLQTKKISELKDMFEQMDLNGLGNDYREFVELKGKIVSDHLVETPFSNRQVAYCKSKLAQVTETKEQSLLECVQYHRTYFQGCAGASL